MNLKQSNNFIWSTSFALGSGAGGYVYQGVHKKTSEPIAVKVFKQCPDSKLLRELEIMRELYHENIVRMIAEEKEIRSQMMVLGMELCNRGSVFDNLCDPKNSCGLKEEEFLCVLIDISSALKYLRDNKIVHRDIKPGNIMMFVSDDNKLICKLIDFGAARILHENQEFSSLLGTEQYLHPDMYERAFLGTPTSKSSFGPTVDLWSFGVTLYHIATGLLPFRPYGGKSNRVTWHRMTTTKESGVISGVQHTKGGQIEWSKQLPKTCLLSQGCQNLVTKLLAGVLESDDEKMWTFDQFFDFVSNIASRKVFHVFYMNEMKEIRLYLEPNKMLDDLKAEIQNQTNVELLNQLLLFEKSPFLSQVDSSLDVSTFPTTTVDHPIILIHTGKTTIEYFHADGFPSTNFPMFPEKVIADKDAQLAKESCCVAYNIKYLVEKLERCQMLLLEIPKIFILLLKDRVAKLCSDLAILQEKIEKADYETTVMERSYSLISSYTTSLPNEKYKKELQQLELTVSVRRKAINHIMKSGIESESSVDKLKKETIISKSLQTQWENMSSDCSNLSGYGKRADTYVGRICESMQVLIQHSRSSYDPMLHDLERQKVKKAIKNLSDLKEECSREVTQTSRKLTLWHSGVLTTMSLSDCMDKNLAIVNEILETYITDLRKVELEVFEANKKILKFLSEKAERKESNEMPSKGKISSAKGDCSKEVQLLQQDQENIATEIDMQSNVLERFFSLFQWS